MVQFPSPNPMRQEEGRKEREEEEEEEGGQTCYLEVLVVPFAVALS